MAARNGLTSPPGAVKFGFRLSLADVTTSDSDFTVSTSDTFWLRHTGPTLEKLLGFP
jgi:hypothetical protein